MIQRLLLLSFLLLCDAKVNLSPSLSPSSSASVCPGGTLVFTCTTDTGVLAWESNGNNRLYPSGQMSFEYPFDIYLLNITNVTEMTVVSTATVQNVLLDYDRRLISCSDSVHKGNMMNSTIQISDPPSQPLSLTFTNSYPMHLSSVTISWVAPLDTPFCVHSYTVTVRNCCNSSQVMVYNTTDTRSSLNITNLTSDGTKYSVTVAGRDGAGRLGQESEELIMNFYSNSKYADALKVSFRFVLLDGEILGAFVSWNYTDNFEQSCFIITHNVSSDQSPIKVNRTNVTLYGVQPGGTYTVEITPCSSNCFFARSSTLQITAVQDVSPNKPVTTTNKYVTYTGIPTGKVIHNTTVWVMPLTLEWVIPVIVFPWVLLIVTTKCLLVYVIAKKVKSKRRNTDINLHSTSSKRSKGVVRTRACYEEVTHAGKDKFGMKDNPSYVTCAGMF